MSFYRKTSVNSKYFSSMIKNFLIHRTTLTNAYFWNFLFFCNCLAFSIKLKANIFKCLTLQLNFMLNVSLKLYSSCVLWLTLRLLPKYSMKRTNRYYYYYYYYHYTLLFLDYWHYWFIHLQYFCSYILTLNHKNFISFSNYCKNLVLTNSYYIFTLFVKFINKLFWIWNWVICLDTNIIVSIYVGEQWNYWFISKYQFQNLFFIQ